MKPWHRFELIDKLDAKSRSKAEAWSLLWDDVTQDWDTKAEIITVHNFDGRHFGLPGEKGWARCEGDSKKTEVVSLGGLVRFGKMAADLNQGGSAQFQIWDAFGGTPSYTGENLTIYDLSLPPGCKIAKNAWVWVEYDPIGEKWFLKSWVKGPLLGKPNADFAQGNTLAQVNIWTGTQGSETNSGKSVQAYNRMFGKLLKVNWCWVDSQDGGVTWEVIATEGANYVYGKVDQPNPSQHLISSTSPGSSVTVHVYLNGADTGSTITAAVEHAPILGNEFVSCSWDGGRYVITRGDYDGGIAGILNLVGNLAKNTPSSAFKLAIYPNSDPSLGDETNFDIVCRLGTLTGGKEVWVSRNPNGWFATSAEC